MRSPEPVEFAPIGVPGRASDEGPAMLSLGSSVAFERVSAGSRGHNRDRLPNGVQVRVDAFVNKRALQRVFRAMKGAM
jgi:transposase